MVRFCCFVFVVIVSLFLVCWFVLVMSMYTHVHVIGASPIPSGIKIIDLNLVCPLPPSHKLTTTTHLLLKYIYCIQVHFGGNYTLIYTAHPQGLRNVLKVDESIQQQLTPLFFNSFGNRLFTLLF